jgi:hypothetical protein
MSDCGLENSEHYRAKYWIRQQLFRIKKCKISYFNLIIGIPQMKNLILARSARAKGFKGLQANVSSCFGEGRAFSEPRGRALVALCADSVSAPMECDSCFARVMTRRFAGRGQRPC